MRMARSSANSKPWWRLLIRTIVVLAVAFAGAGIASQAAFQQRPPQSLAESQNFWQQKTAATIENTTQPENKNTDKATETKTNYPVADIKTNASAYLVSDLESGQILAAKNPNQKQPIASLTKLMTAVVAHEAIGNNTSITISDSAVATYGGSGGLAAGTTLSLRTLYRPLLLSSSNDAATAIAEKRGVERFRNLMNRKALAIGMNNTRFADASGLSDHNISTVTDLGRLARYIHNHNQFIFDITADAQQTVAARQSGPRQYVNNNPIHTEPGFVGGKNGYTDFAQHTALSVFKITKDGRSRSVVIVTLGSDQAAEDTRKLVSWTKRQ